MSSELSLHSSFWSLRIRILLRHCPSPRTHRTLQLVPFYPKVLGFCSKKLSEAEKKYSSFDKELLALYFSIKHFRCHLEGRQFTAWTDHKPLCGAIGSVTERSPLQTRHLSFITEFTTDIRHVPGVTNVVADCLSRPQLRSCYSDRHCPMLWSLWVLLAAQSLRLGVTLERSICSSWQEINISAALNFNTFVIRIALWIFSWFLFLGQSVTRSFVMSQLAWTSFVDGKDLPSLPRPTPSRWQTRIGVNEVSLVLLSIS